MDSETVARELLGALESLPLFDVHTHLVGDRPGASGLHDILLYHMVISDLYAAGCPSGQRLTQFPHTPSDDEARHRIAEALPYLDSVRNTSSWWGVRLILRDLYDWCEPVTTENWQRLDAVVRERAEDASWADRVWEKAGIQRVGTELARRGRGEGDPRMVYALEWGFFTRCQWGEYDTALYELERCWGRTPESPSPIGGGARPRTDRTIVTLDDLHAAVEHYVRSIPYGQVCATATHVSTDLDLRPVSEADVTAALRRRATAGPAERDVYASYVNEAFLTALEAHGDEIVFQFSLGAEPLPFETGSRLSQRTVAQLGEIVAAHPGLRFQCFLSSAHGNQSLCTLARELPNLSLAGYWWHNFFPETIRRVMSERLDMVPVNKQIGFFSDAYCVEWSYAKATIVRRQLATVLAQRVVQGQYTLDEAVCIAREILWETPQGLLGDSVSAARR